MSEYEGKKPGTKSTGYFWDVTKQEIILHYLHSLNSIDAKSFLFLIVDSPKNHAPTWHALF